jgi:hypothetical protein
MGRSMGDDEFKENLHDYLQAGRDAMSWKLEGLTEYDMRRPLTPTGTNLLGLVKHLVGCESGYFGAVFGRPFDEPPWLVDQTDPNADMWATAGESRDDIVEWYRRACSHSDATIRSSALDSTGLVEHWPPERRVVTLHQILVHMTAETHRHAGHADVVRELIDGSVGSRRDRDNMAPGDQAWWAQYRLGVERAAQEAHRR